MLTFFGDLIAKREVRSQETDGWHEYHIRLYRTEAPGYVLAVSYRDGATHDRWAAHTPRRLEVAELFRRYIRDREARTPALKLLHEAMQDIMLQAPELDELVQWSSVVATEQ